MVPQKEDILLVLCTLTKWPDSAYMGNVLVVVGSEEQKVTITGMQLEEWGCHQLLSGK